MRILSAVSKSALWMFLVFAMLHPAGLYAATGSDFYVDDTAAGANNGSGWSNAYTDLQSALTAAVSGDTIHVAKGTYKPTSGSDREATFQLKTSVTLLGGYPDGGGTRDPKANVTTLSGDLLGNDGTFVPNEGGDPTRDDNSYHVVTGSGTDTTAVLDGFFISGGNANDYYALGGTAGYGAGMFNNAGNPTVQNVTFSKNKAMNYGGGMYNSAGSNPVIADVSFTNNWADYGGGMFNDASSPSIRNTTFSNNTVNNGGGGVYNGNNSSPDLTNVTFSGNSAYGGGGMKNEGSGSNPTLMSVTFSNNSGNSGAGGIGNTNDASPVLTNCILWSDSSGGSVEIDGTPTVTNSVVQGGYTGTGNLSTDPNLGPLGSYGGYAQTVPLLPNSSAIDAGTATGAPSTDQRGITRPQGSGYDIGAFERDSTTAPQPAVIGINPDHAYPIEPINVTINGANFTGSPSVYFQKSGSASIKATNVSLVSAGTITCTLDMSGAAVGGWNVVVLNSDGRSGALSNGFTALDIPHGDIYVDHNASGPSPDGTSWSTAFRDLAGVLAASQSGDTIHVATGTYKPATDGVRSKTFQLKNGVTLLGGYPTGGGTRDYKANVTTLSGDLLGNDNSTISRSEPTRSDNSCQVVIGSGTDDTAVLDGFFISGGNTDGCTISDGAGMYNDSGSPTVRNTSFNANSAYDGGGMYNYNGNGTLTMTNVTFSNNTADGTGGGMRNYNNSLTLSNMTFSKNSASNSGGGMYNDTSTVTLTNATFSHNSSGSGSGYGGGMYNYTSDLTLKKATFSDNTASYEGGGLYIYYNTSTLTNVTFSGNSAEYGGGMQVDDGTQTLTNVTFNNNTASDGVGGGGGIYISGHGALTATNCILWGDSSDELYDDYGTGTVTYSVVQGGYAGTGNLSSDPMLGTLGNNGGYTQTIQLLAGSPAIDAGTATGAPSVDQRGIARPQGGGYDIGAFEYAMSTTLDSDKASPQLIGSSIKFTAAGSGGSGDYEYKFWLKTGGIWSTVQVYSTTDTWTWNTMGESAGTYGVQVYIRKVGSKAKYEAIKTLSYVLVYPPTAGATLSPDLASPLLIGNNNITFTAGGVGGSGNYEYRFWLKTGGVWSPTGAYSTTDTWTWNTLGVPAGTYGVQVYVRNAGSSAKSEAVKNLSYVLVPSTPATGATLSPDHASPQTAGTDVTFTAGGVGGSGSYEYKFWVKAAGVWTPMQGYSATETWTWDTTGLTPGSYRVQVYVRNVGSSAQYEAVSGMAYVIQ